MNRYIVLICFTLLLLVGCKKNMEKEWDEFDAMIQSEETNSPVTDVTEESYATYVGENIELPENILDGSETLLSITAGDGTSLELYSINLEETENGPYHQYILLDSGEWESRECKINEQINAFLEENPSYTSISLNNIKRGKNGDLYAMGNVTYEAGEEEEEEEEDDGFRMYGNSKVFSLGLEGEEFYELLLENPVSETEGEEEELWIVDFDVFENGEFFVQYNGMNAIMDPSSGEVLRTYEAETGNRGFSVVNLGQNEIFSVEVMNSKFNITEAVTGEAISSITHTIHERSNFPSWRATSNDKGVFFADISGIYKASSYQATGFHQLISSADSNDFTNLYMTTFLVDDSENVFILFLDMANRFGAGARAGAAEGDNLSIGYKMVKYAPSSE